MSTFQKELTNEIRKFIDQRDWLKFQTGKDSAALLSVEANEVLELFLWKSEDEVDVAALHEEIGDVFYSLLLLASQFDIDIREALIEKIKKNKKKYPVTKFKGINKKYNELE